MCQGRNVHKMAKYEGQNELINILKEKCAKVNLTGACV